MTTDLQSEKKSFKTVVCSMLGTPLMGAFQQFTARILSMFFLGLWPQKPSFLQLSADRKKLQTNMTRRLAPHAG